MSIFTTYQEEAAKTINYTLSYEMRLMEMGLGICGEVGEMIKILNSPFTRRGSIVQLMDEGGDVNWYAAGLCTLVEYEFAKFFETESHVTPSGMAQDKIVIAAAEIADAIKKAVAQGHKLDKRMITSQLKSLVDNLWVLFQFYGIKYGDVLHYNNDKTNRRYPNGFESIRSINREV